MAIATVVSVIGLSTLLAQPQLIAQQEAEAVEPDAEDLPAPYLQEIVDGETRPVAPGTEAPPAPEVDLYEDDALAQTYDDGYDPQAAAQFATALDPYGTWFDDSTYGRLWSPSVTIVGAGFSPYASGGHWVLSDFGWTWVSDFSWGWAPFHYGRWMVIGGRGWCWMPGTQWGPGWVAWRAGGGFVGWTPLPFRGVPLPRPSAPHAPWRFSTARGMDAPRPAYLPPNGVRGAFRRTMPVMNARGTPGAGRLAEIAPRALPQAPIQARAGGSMSRPWFRAAAAAGTTMGSAAAGRPTFGGRSGSGSVYSRPWAKVAGGGLGGAAAGGARPVPGFPRAGAGVGRSFAPAPRATGSGFAGAPRMFSGASAGVGRSFAPAPRATGSGFAGGGFSSPGRSFAPAPRSFGGGGFSGSGRSFAPAPRGFSGGFSGVGRSFAPAPRASSGFPGGGFGGGGFASPGRSFSAPARSFSPAPRAAPRGGGSFGGGVGGARVGGGGFGGFGHRR